MILINAHHIIASISEVVVHWKAYKFSLSHMQVSRPSPVKLCTESRSGLTCETNHPRDTAVCSWSGRTVFSDHSCNFCSERICSWSKFQRWV